MILKYTKLKLKKYLPCLPGNHQFILDDMLHHARQDSRHNRLYDVFHRSIDRSDPVILSQSTEYRLKEREKNKHPVPAEVLALMKDPVEGTLDHVLNFA